MDLGPRILGEISVTEDLNADKNFFFFEIEIFGHKNFACQQAKTMEQQEKLKQAIIYRRMLSLYLRKEAYLARGVFWRPTIFVFVQQLQDIFPQKIFCNHQLL
eukprot:TRINITY_DN7370_c0_g1_i10.p8 TRINITY_DN7370_c0_g1~~TRINITY_DN7370_c0_g1_i10.p8  ORF type:complete len:103 (-),score=8.01 TRINITY_DN7370_c0_g1_i10:644-952(-)